MILNLKNEENRRSIIWLGKLIIIVLFLFNSCATKKAYDSMIAPVSILHVPEAELANYGANSSANPYREPRKLIFGQSYEFYMVKISLNLESKTRIRIETASKAPIDANVPIAYSQKEFIRFCDIISNEGGPDSAEYEKRKAIIERTMIPAFDFSESPGQHDYYLVFVNKRPFKRPIYYEVRVILENGESFLFNDSVE
jgi:hypothetical protein